MMRVFAKYAQGPWALKNYVCSTHMVWVFFFLGSLDKIH